MSPMPSPGSVVRLTDGRYARVTRVTPLGDDDRVQDVLTLAEERVTIDDIAAIVYELNDPPLP